jgi:hypothetical protein
VAAFCSAAGEDCATVFGLHALTETVSLGPLPIIRLKSTFWHIEIPERRLENLESALLSWSQNSDYKGWAAGKQT